MSTILLHQSFFHTESTPFTKNYYYATVICNSWHRMLCHSLVRSVFMEAIRILLYSSGTELTINSIARLDLIFLCYPEKKNSKLQVATPAAEKHIKHTKALVLQHTTPAETINIK